MQFAYKCSDYIQINKYQKKMKKHYSINIQQYNY
jgi:hypothetical protein